MFARIQRRTGRQLIMSTHSSDPLRGDGIGKDEVLLLVPGREGTEVKALDTLAQVDELLSGGLSVADIVMPATRPEKAEQLALFADIRR